MSAFSFTMFLNDLVSPKLTQISTSLNNSQSKVSANQSKMQKDTDKTAYSIEQLRNKLTVLNGQHAASTSISEIRRLKTEINQTERELNKLKNLPPMGFIERLRGIGGQFSSLIMGAGALGLAMKAWDGIKALFNMGVDMEQTNIKFEVLLGSTEKATKMIGELTKYADATPYSNEGINKSAETMLGFGIAQEKIMSNMKMLGDVAMGNEEKLSGLSLVYSQVQATGRLMGQDLLQMINQGFNPLQIISEQTGISMGDLKEKMEDGAISSQMVEEAFKLATSEGGRYYDMANKMAESGGGKWSTFWGTLTNQISRVGVKFVELIKPIFDIGTSVALHIVPFGKSILNIIKYVTDCKPLMFLLAVAVGAVGFSLLAANANAITFSVVMGVLEGAIWLVEAATTAWNFVMNLNPISLVVIAIAALVAAIWACWQKFELFRGTIMGVWEVLKGFGTAIKDYVITRFKELLSGITGIGSALLSFFKGDWQKAWETGKKAVEDLSGVNSKQKFVSDVIENGKKIGENFSKGYAKGVAMVAPEVVTKAGTAPQAAPEKKAQDKSSAFNDLFHDDDKKKEKKHAHGGADNADKVISGGAKTTHLTININELGKTTINVERAENGINSMADTIKEVLLRTINSVNQMQIA